MIDRSSGHSIGNTEEVVVIATAAGLDETEIQGGRNTIEQAVTVVVS